MTSACPQVSWSSQAVVRLVPGSVEQRGTDLERFMRGADRFSRPVSTDEGAFLFSVQLAGEGAGGGAMACMPG